MLSLVAGVPDGCRSGPELFHFDWRVYKANYWLRNWVREWGTVRKDLGCLVGGIHMGKYLLEDCMHGNGKAGLPN